MKRTILASALFLLIFFTACSGADSEQPTANPDRNNPPLESIDIVTEPALPAPTDMPEAYQALQPTEAADAYPAESDTAVDLPAYPATGTIWVIRPLGQQCQQASEFEYENIEAAIVALDEVGVRVYIGDVVFRPACASCDCPTSEQFRVRIDESNLEQAPRARLGSGGVGDATLFDGW